MPRTPRPVIFDMDGLLVDSEPLYQRAWQAAARRLDVEISDAAYAGLIGRSEAESERDLLAWFGDAFPLTRFRTLWKRTWRELVADGELRAKPGAEALLARLDAGGTSLALATSSTQEYAEPSLAGTGLARFFAHVVTVEQVARGKPAPDLYLAAAARLDAPPAHCLVLEDSPTGAEAAFAAGMEVILVPDLQPATEACVARALGVYPSLADAAPHVLRAVGDASPLSRGGRPA